MEGAQHFLFACGSFQQAAVQEQVFGHQLLGRPDTLAGFRRKPFVQRSDLAHEQVNGTVLTVTDADLAAADAFEPPNYRRSQVRTVSGLLVWVYLRQD